MSHSFQNIVSSSVMPPKRKISPGLARMFHRMNIIEPDHIEEVLSKIKNSKLLSYMSENMSLDEDKTLEDISEKLSISIIDLQKEGVVEEASRLIFPLKFTKNFALEHRCLPYMESEDGLHVAFADPLDFEVINQIEFMFQTRVIVSISQEASIIMAINRLFSESGNVQVITSDGNKSTLSKRDIKEASKAAPVVKFVNKIISDSINENASDIHLEPSGDTFEIRFRIDGIMKLHASVPERLKPYIITRIKILADMDIAERRKPQDGSFSVKISGGYDCDLRVSSVPTPEGEKLVLRLLGNSLNNAKFDSLGMHPVVFEQFKEAISSPDKIICVTGPTGSGKSTTLYAALRYLKDGTNNIITVEDPIEYRLKGITQIQVDSKIGMTFSSGLRSILRQDPDIILVGEIRDLETAEVAFQAAQTGHLVLTTLHTNNAPAAVIRLGDLGLEPYVLSSSLGGILAQRLVRKLCDFCSKPLTPSELKAFKAYSNLDASKAKRGVGCKKCGNSGYMGRVGVYSFLKISKKIREGIRDSLNEDKIVEIAKEEGFVDLWQSAIKLASEGITTLDEVIRVLGGLRDIENLDDENKEEEKEEVSLKSSSSISILEMADGMREIESQLESKVVLLIDDDKHVRKIMKRELKKENFQIIEAACGEEGLKKAKESNPDLILCDFIMPGYDGKQVVQSIRKDSLTRDIPTIMLTSTTDEATEISLIKAGADDFITKSSSAKVVVARIKRFLKIY